MVNYCLKNNIITKDNIKFELIASLTVEGDYFNDVINEFINMPYGLDKHAPNIFIGLFNKLSVKVNKLLYSLSFKYASSFFLKHQGNDLHIKKINNSNVYKVTTSQTFESQTSFIILFSISKPMNFTNSKPSLRLITDI